MATSLSTTALSKIVLHCAKYPHKDINGLLLAEQNSTNQELVLVDSIPLFHFSTGLTPMLEIALHQVDIDCTSRNLIIAGCYHANAKLDDSSPPNIAKKLVEKIAEAFPKAVLLMIDNTKLNLDLDLSEPYVSAYSVKDGNIHDKSRCSVEEGASQVAATLLQGHEHRNLVDFDNHLDDITQDWRNPQLTELVAGLEV